MSERVRVGIVDDHAMVREALASVLSGPERLEVVAQAEDTPGAIDLVRGDKPDVLVLDYNIPGGGALPVLEEVERSKSEVRVLVLTVHENPQYALRVLEAGAHGFMLKSSAVGELVSAIDAVRRGEMYITPKLSRDVIDRLRRPKKGREGIDSLSTREFEMLRLLGAGLELKGAARELKISVSTASTYRARILEKLGLDGTSALIRFAIEHGLAD